MNADDHVIPTRFLRRYIRPTISSLFRCSKIAAKPLWFPSKYHSFRPECWPVRQILRTSRVVVGNCEFVEVLGGFSSNFGSRGSLKALWVSPGRFFTAAPRRLGRRLSFWFLKGLLPLRCALLPLIQNGRLHKPFYFWQHLRFLGLSIWIRFFAWQSRLLTIDDRNLLCKGHSPLLWI